jgi:hypothetical protein
MGSVSEKIGLGVNLENEVRTLRALLGKLEKEYPKGSYYNRDIAEKIK